MLNTIKNDAELKYILSQEVEEYFNTFITKALCGEFDEVSDVTLFIEYSKDRFGLPLYYRLRGTVRTENLHQKMKTAIGPWNIGAKSGHMTLVLVSYRYNVHSMIKRCGAYDFGHCELHLIDRIQNRVQEIFNILPWPRHKNISYFCGKSDMISVGIGPLSYDSTYVVKGKPDENLKGDLYFIAKQMGLKYPILHIGSSAEIKLFNEFMMSNKGTKANFKELARIFRDKADGKNIFFKLPSMLKTYHGTWEKIQK